MLASSSWNRPLTCTQLWLLCSAALALHIVPLLMADMPFLDDYYRVPGAYSGWEEVGRPLANALFGIFGFAAGAVDVYPLPLLVMVVITGHALGRLVGQWFRDPTISAVLVVLPLWFHPLFLQNLSYHYDGASMALSLVASLWAITVGANSAKRWLAGIVLVASGAALYQPSVNVFVGLCAVEVIREVVDGRALGPLCRQLLIRSSQVLLGGGLYYVTCAWMVKSTRAGLLAFDGQWLVEIGRRLEATAEVVSLLLTPATVWMFTGLLMLALLGLLRELWQIRRRPVSWAQRMGLMAVVIIPIPLVCLCIPGIVLFLAEFETTVRPLMGLGVVLVLLLYLSYRALVGLPGIRLLILAITLLFMLSFSYAYGRVLVLQKELQQSITHSMAHDLWSKPELRAANHYYLIDYWMARTWIPAARGTLERLPAIEVINIYHYMALPEMLPRVGVDDMHPFFERPPLDREQVIATSPTPLISSKFYDIHMVGDAAYVLVNRPPEAMR